MTSALQATVEYVNIDREIDQSKHGSSLTAFNLGLTHQIQKVKLNAV